LQFSLAAARHQFQSLNGADGAHGPAGQDGQDAPADPDPIVVQFLDTVTCHQLRANTSARRQNTSTVKVYSTTDCTGSSESMTATGNEFSLTLDGLFMVHGSGVTMIGILFL